MDRDSVEVFLPDADDCYERLRRARFGATVSCVYCGESEPVIKKGTTCKGAQQYRCKECETYFNDLTGTVFGQRRFGIEEMFYIIAKMSTEPISQLARDLDRDYEAVRAFVHQVEEDNHELDLPTLCSLD